MERVKARADLDKGRYLSTEEDYEMVLTGDDYNLVTSRVAGWRVAHAPVLDIDVPHQVVPSSQEGHSHIYFDVECSWEDYVTFLDAAAKIGILEQGFVDASKNRGFTSVRRPGLQKTKNQLSKAATKAKDWLL